MTLASSNYPEDFYRKLRSQFGIYLNEGDRDRDALEAMAIYVRCTLDESIQAGKQELEQKNSRVQKMEDAIAIIELMHKIIPSSRPYPLKSLTEDGEPYVGGPRSSIDLVSLKHDLMKLRDHFQYSMLIAEKKVDYLSKIPKRKKWLREKYWLFLWCLWGKQFRKDPKCYRDPSKEQYVGEIISFIQLASQRYFPGEASESAIVNFWSGPNGKKDKILEHIGSADLYLGLPLDPRED